MLATDHEAILTQAQSFTEAYKRWHDAHPAIREVRCLEAQLPYILGPIDDNDLLAGRWHSPAVGFSPEWGGFGYYCQDAALRQVSVDCDAAQQQELEKIIAFWRDECTHAQVRRAYSPQLARALPLDNFFTPGIAFPLYRIGGLQPNLRKLVTIGLPGLEAEVRASQDRPGADRELFDGMLQSLDLLRTACRHYGAEARHQAAACCRPERQQDLTALADSLEAIQQRPPRRFHEAAQLAWLYAMLAGALNYGRLDVTLGDFYAADIDSGLLTEAAAQRLVDSLWQLIAARRTTYNGRVWIGGCGRAHETAADRFALAAITATANVMEIEPQLSLRFHHDQSPALYQRGMELIGCGRTYPMLYNDDANVPAIAAAMNVSVEEARQYTPLGCGEYMLEHRSVGTPSGLINLLQALLVTLNNGIDPVSGETMGLALGDLTHFATFDQLWAAYRQQVEYYVTALAEQEKLEYDVFGRSAPLLLQSMLYDDCLQRGKPLLAGGVRHLGGTCELYGNTNTADSLTAIKHLVYDTSAVAPAHLLQAIRTDFTDQEPLRARLLAAPKYGNDDEQADAMAVTLHEFVCTAIRDQAGLVGLDSYLAVIINNSTNSVLGRVTGASPDGRRAGQPLANANNPSGGADRSGLTAMLNSLVKLRTDLHAGAVQNIKLSPELFRGANRPKLDALLETYFASGGAQAMISVVNRGELEAALREPEKYQHVMVRVGGFSARFVTLDRTVQEEILSRTLY